MVYGLMILKLWLKIKWDFDFRFVGPLRGLSNNPFLETRRNSFFGFLVSYEIRNFSWTRNLGCEFEEAMTVKQPKNRVMKKKSPDSPSYFPGGNVTSKNPKLEPMKNMQMRMWVFCRRESLENLWLCIITGTKDPRMISVVYC